MCMVMSLKRFWRNGWIPSSNQINQGLPSSKIKRRVHKISVFLDNPPGSILTAVVWVPDRRTLAWVVPPERIPAEKLLTIWPNGGVIDRGWRLAYAGWPGTGRRHCFGRQNRFSGITIKSRCRCWASCQWFLIGVNRGSGMTTKSVARA